MFRRVSLFQIVIPLLVAGSEDDSVNLLQTVVHKHKISDEVADNKKKCVVKGDPHINLFSQPDSDGAKMNLFGTYGDYWLVDTPQLKVMGRIGGTDLLENGYGVVKGIAVTGPLMENEVLEIPPTNNGEITFNGSKISFPWTSPGGTVTILDAPVPNFNDFGSAKFSTGKLRKNGFTIKMGDKAQIRLNQDVFQHLEITADPDIVADDAGKCTKPCKDFFRCGGGTCDMSETLFSTEHKECGEVIVRVKCSKLRLKLATDDCVAKFDGDPPNGMAVQNCIEDCCSDRDQCPDRGSGDGLQTCLVYGDPHIKGFDASYTSVNTYSPIGVHDLIKSDHIQVQARYSSGDKIWAQMRGIAMKGDMVSAGGTDVLYFRSNLDGAGVLVNDKNVMPCKGAALCSPDQNIYVDPNGHYNITFGDGDDIPALLKEERPVPQRANVHIITFKEGAVMKIHQGAGQSIYMQIDSYLLRNVSGECGNANGNPDDDVHDDFDEANTHCASQDEIFVPNGTVCQAIEGGNKCRGWNTIKPWRKQCMKELGMKGALSKYTFSEKRMAKDCMRDCCLGGTCPMGSNLKNDPAY